MNARNLNGNIFLNILVFFIVSVAGIAGAFPADSYDTDSYNNNARSIDSLGAGSAKRDKEGRAYRVDGNGFQITDHVAELEVTVDELRRQVQILEDQLKAKEQQCGRSPKPVLPSTPIKELDITTHPVSSDRVSDETVDCSRDVRNAQVISALKTQNSQLVDKIANLESIIKSKQSNNAQAESLIKELQEQRDDIQAESEKLQVELQKVRQELQNQAHENSVLQVQLKEKIINSSQGRDELYRAKFNDSALDEEPEIEVASLAESKHKINTHIKTIQSLINQRKDLVDSLRSSSLGVSVSISPLRAQSGLSLDIMRAKAPKLSDANEAAEIALGLSQVQKVLQDDIAVMKRLSKM